MTVGVDLIGRMTKAEFLEWLDVVIERKVIETVWIVEPEASGPRLITAYPSRRRTDDQGT